MRAVEVWRAQYTAVAVLRKSLGVASSYGSAARQHRLLAHCRLQSARLDLPVNPWPGTMLSSRRLQPTLVRRHQQARDSTVRWPGRLEGGAETLPREPAESAGGDTGIGARLVKCVRPADGDLPSAVLPLSIAGRITCGPPDAGGESPGAAHPGRSPRRPAAGSPCPGCR